MTITLNKSQLKLLANYCNDIAKGLTLAYLLGSAITGKPPVIAIAATIHATLTVGLLLAIGVTLLKETI